MWSANSASSSIALSNVDPRHVNIPLERRPRTQLGAGLDGDRPSDSDVLKRVAPALKVMTIMTS